MSNFTNEYFKQSDVWKEEIEPYQYQVLNDILEILPSDIDSLLDVGCGNGLITNRLPKDLRVVGLDLSHEALKSVQREKVVGDVRDLPFEDNSFDLVMANDVIEHLSLDEAEEALKEISRVAGKYIIITVPFTEDLNANMVKCKECGRYYHVNHHKRTFNLDGLKNLVTQNGYVLDSQVLSGDVWNRDPFEISLAKKQLLLDTPFSEGLICNYCGSEIAETGIENVILKTKIQKLESEVCINNTYLIDACMLRTECISIYKRSDIHLKGASLANKFKRLDECPHESISNNIIDLRSPKLYKQEFLPLYSPNPYFLCNELKSEGACLSDSVGVLFGFFCPEDKNSEKAILKLFGKSQGPSILVIYSYDNDIGYVLVSSIEVCDRFSVSIEINRLVFSSYGILFSIKSQGNEVILTQATLTGVVEQEFKLYKTNKDLSFLKLLSGDDLYLSLRFYEENPIISRGWMEVPEFWSTIYLPLEDNIDRKNFSGVLEKLCIDLANKSEQLILSNSNLENKLSVLQDAYNELEYNNELLITQQDTLLSEVHKVRGLYENIKVSQEDLTKEYEELMAKYERTLSRRVKRFINKL
ncbi:class I SAM-dependent methyltransferase [Desulfosporosinus fructosivorans]